MRRPLGLFVVVVTLVCGSASAARRSPPRHKGPPVLELQPGSARPGDVVSITLNRAGPTPEGKLGHDTLLFFPLKSGKGFRAFAPLSVDEKPGTLPVHVRVVPPPPPSSSRHRGKKPKAPEPWEMEAQLEIVPPNFPRRELRVASKFVEPPASVKKQLAEDRKAFKHAYQQKDVAPLFTGNFGWPRKAIITAPFGDLRTYNGRKQSQHYGMDLEGRVGEPILAANDGVVVMVRPAYGSGNTVLVHHGARLFTAYFHMSAFEVKEGQKVKRGQRLGKVGSTGRVTGPHLHFAVKLDGKYVDPASLLRLRL